MLGSRSLTLVCLVAMLGCAVSTVTTPKAKLLASKKVHNSYLVEGEDVVVEYSIFNVGTAAALNVQLTDTSFATDSFEIVAGRTSVKFERIAPETNVTHIIVLRPKMFGYFNFTSADVNYQPTEESADVQVLHTSTPGEGGILPSAEFQRRFSPHLLDWALFACMLVPVLVVPALAWHNINTRFQLSAKKMK